VQDYDFVEDAIVVIWLCAFDLVLEGVSGDQCANLLFSVKLDFVA
jgi:hypothetical protein